MTAHDEPLGSALDRASAIASSGVDLYRNLLPDQPELFIRDTELQALLIELLVGETLSGPIRTRSKLAKELVAIAMGYDAPDVFRKERPRFPGQDLDVHVQTSDNLQIWNQEVSPERRYVLIRPDGDGLVRDVRVVRGQQVASWDRTGTLTSKYQAKRIAGRLDSILASSSDTNEFSQILRPEAFDPSRLPSQGSSDPPEAEGVMSIAEIFRLSCQLIGTQLDAVRPEQDRNRGELLQAAVSKTLGIGRYENHGQWPDIVSQALEVKLQTAQTIDLGLVLPTDTSPALAIDPNLRHCDARYLIAYGESDEFGITTIEQIVVVTGADFFSEFVQFGGLVENSKRQIRLPSGLFEA